MAKIIGREKKIKELQELYKREERYRLIDPFCLFYQKFVENQPTLDEEFWMHNVASAKLNSWRGFAFEEVCFKHKLQIKKALGISGVSTQHSAWAIKGDEDTEGGQIDMLIDRKDNVVNMCEMKFYNEEFTINKNYHAKLVHRQNILTSKLPRRKVIHSTLVTTYGLTYNEYSNDFQQVVTLEDLFK